MRSRYERTRSAVRRVLATRLPVEPARIEIMTTPAGKPWLNVSPSLYFSISHSADRLVIALCAEEIGVDVEIIRPRENCLELAARFFSASDHARIFRAEPARREVMFLRQWVAKEAALKAAGCGLAEALKQAECGCEGDEIAEVSWPGSRARVRPFEIADGAEIGAFAWMTARDATVHWHEGADLGI